MQPEDPQFESEIYLEGGPQEFLEPYTEAQSGSVQPDSPGVIEHFPTWLSRFPHNGFVSNEEGDSWCGIPKISSWWRKSTYRVPGFADCDRLSKHLEDGLQNDPKYLETKKQAKEDLILGDKGASVKVLDSKGTGIEALRVFTLPQKIQNQQAALQYLERTVLQDPHFFDQTEEEILETFKKTNKILLAKLPDPMRIFHPGRYRTQSVMVGEFYEFSYDEFKRVLKKRGGTSKDVEHLDSIAMKHARYGTFEKAYEQFTEAEIESYKKIGHFAPMPDQIRQEMRNFAKALREVGPKVINRELSAISAASWVHAELGRIHPFGDGNGREARAWTDVMLQLGGYRGVIFPDDEEYTKAVEADQSQPGQFTPFLEETIAWARTQEALS